MSEQLKLFKGLGVFQKERPSKFSERQLNAFLLEYAETIISNKWVTNFESVQDVIDDLKFMCNISHYNYKNPYLNHSMYDMEEETLEDIIDDDWYCYYVTGDIKFIEYIQKIPHDFLQLLRTALKEWGVAHNIKPKFKLGTVLRFHKPLGKHNLHKYDKVIIEEINYDTFIYKLSDIDKPQVKHVFYLNFEDLENFEDFEIVQKTSEDLKYGDSIFITKIEYKFIGKSPWGNGDYYYFSNSTHDTILFTSSEVDGILKDFKK